LANNKLLIENLKIENLRNISKAEISPHKKINIILGRNGAGKTTLLESIYLLARAKSFRQIKSGPLIQEGKEKLTLFTKIKNTTNTKHQIGLQKSKHKTEIRKDGEILRKLSVLAKTLPLTIITPNIQRIIEENPEQRRRLLNWGLFHVEPEYSELAFRYKKTLLQRNSALRGSLGQVKVWNMQLVEIGEQIDEMMVNYSRLWNETFRTLINSSKIIDSVSLDIKKGWREEETFREALLRTSNIDRERGFTSCGPHRADIRLVKDGKLIKNIFSRGEAKITAVTMLLSQTKMLADRTGDAPILLADDLHSELDSERYNRLLNLITDLKLQSFITTLDFSKEIHGGYSDSYRLFHVEHGSFSEA
jgi:DNA replication and repair protein RecF